MLEGKSREEAMEFAKERAQNEAIELKKNFNIIADKLSGTSTNINSYSEQIKEINELLVSGNLSPEATESAKLNLIYYETLQNNALSRQAEIVKEMHNLSGSPNLNSSPDLGESNSMIVKSDFSELFTSISDTVKDYLSVLTSEQLVIVFNLCGYTILIMLMTSITTIVIGQDLINYFKLESNYPKISTYIQFQLTLRKYYLTFYILNFYLIFLILISINIFMFSFDFFYF